MFGSEYIQFKKTEAYLTPKGWCQIGYNHTKTVVVNISKKRDSWAEIVKEGRGEGALYLLSSLPADKQALVEERILAPYSLEAYRLKYWGMEKERLIESEKRELRALFSDWMKNYKGYLGFYEACTEVQAKGLAVYCSILSGVVSEVREGRLNINKSMDLLPICELAKDYKLPYVAKNWRILQRKVMPVLHGEQLVNEVVQLPRSGKNNPYVGKFKVDEELMSWMLDLRSRTSNNPNVYVQRKISMLCELVGKKCPSHSWMAQKMADSEFRRKCFSMSASATRHGLKYRLYTPFKGALHAGDAWEMDGTRVNFASFKHANGRRGFLYIVAVRDVYSGDILGVSFALKEDSRMYREALGMAVKTSGYFPYEVVFDRFPGHNSEQWKALQGAVAHKGLSKFRYTEKAEGKARWERWWATLQTVFMEDSEYYYGEGILASRAHSRKHEKYLKLLTKKLEDKEFTDVWQEAWSVITGYRHTPLNKYRRDKKAKVVHSAYDLHRLSERPATKDADELNIAWLFWEKTVLQIRGNVLKKEHKGAVLYYKLWSWEQWKGEEAVVLAYDPLNMKKAYVFKENGELIEEVSEWIPPVTYGPDADWETAGKEIAKQKALKAQIHQEALLEIEKGRKAMNYIDEETGELCTVSIEQMGSGLWDKYKKEDAETAYLLENEGRALREVARQSGLLKEEHKKNDGWRSDTVDTESKTAKKQLHNKEQTKERTAEDIQRWVQKMQWGV